MPVAQQNAMVAKYCGVCHTDAQHNGGLSLQHFDAAHPDPGLMAMLAAKLRTGAFGASGQPLPDKATQDALRDALTTASAGAEKWFIQTSPVLTASIVRQLPSTFKEAHGEPDLYRLTITCRPGPQQGEMLLAWSPAEPKQGQQMSATIDGNAPETYKIEGHETMGNGNKGTSGPGSINLTPILPTHTLTISNVLPDETVVFQFDELPSTARRQLSACFPAR